MVFFGSLVCKTFDFFTILCSHASLSSRLLLCWSVLFVCEGGESGGGEGRKMLQVCGVACFFHVCCAYVCNFNASVSMHMSSFENFPFVVSFSSDRLSHGLQMG